MIETSQQVGLAVTDRVVALLPVNASAGAEDADEASFAISNRRIDEVHSSGMIFRQRSRSLGKKTGVYG